MAHPKHRISDVIYNAATQSFEARVTLFEATGAATYAASYHAPLDTAYAEASAALVRNAQDQARTRAGLVMTMRPLYKGAMLRFTRSVASGTPDFTDKQAA